MNAPNSIESNDEMPIDTLTAFVRDAEHDLLSLVTALQAHIDLLHDELVRHHLPIDRFAILNRVVGRLITNVTDLVAIAEMAHAPRSTQTLILEVLMHEIEAETRSTFSKDHVSLSCDIEAGTTMIGDAASVKAMITGMVLVMLSKCEFLETVRIVGTTHDRLLSLTCGIGLEPSKGVFKPWRLGELRLLPTNGEGLCLSAVDAMARLHDGQLSVSTLPNHRQGYKLTFAV